MKNIHVPNTGVLSGIDLVTEVNDGFDSLQTNIAGVLNKNVTGLSGITLSNDESYYGIIEFNGKSQCVSDWAKEIGIQESSLRERLDKWPLEKALTQVSKVKEK